VTLDVSCSVDVSPQLDPYGSNSQGNVFGLAAGTVGAALDVAGSLAGFQRIAAIVASVTMILWGVLALLQIRGVRVFKHGTGTGRIATLLAGGRPR
jgi:sulfite exporter TauE/SafE